MKKYQKIIFGIVVAALIAATCAPLAFGRKAHALVYYENLFYGDNVTAEYGKAPDAVQAFDNRPGLTLTASSEGASAKFIDIISGEFEAEFRAFSQRKDVYDLESLEFVFKDVYSGDSFSVEVGLMGDGMTGVSGSPVRISDDKSVVRAAVKTADDKAYGIDYDFGIVDACGVTIHSSFCNNESQSAVVKFDPTAGRVYVRDGNAVTYKLLLDLKDPDQLKATGRDNPIGEFGAYTVEVKFARLSENAKQGNVIFYSLFGTTLEKAYTESAVPSVYVGKIDKLRAGTEIDVASLASVYDFLSGRSAFKGTVSVKDPKGATETLTDRYDYAFDESGVYALTYDCGGGKPNTVRVEAVEYSEAFVCDRELPFSETTRAGVGARVIFPALKVKSNYRSAAEAATLTIKRDDEQVFAASAAGDNAYEFSVAGEYTVGYSLSGSQYLREFTFIISDDLPQFAGETVNTTYALGSVLTVPVKSAILGGYGHDVTATVVQSDGSESAYGEVYLTAPGNGKVRYTATIDGREYEYEEYFTVMYSAENLWESVMGTEITGNTDLPDYFDAYGNGVVLMSTRSGATARYKNVVDLSRSNLSVPVIEAAFTPQTMGTKEFTSLEIRLVDAHDEENYVAVRIEEVSYGYNYSCSVICGANTKNRFVGLKSGKVSTDSASATRVATAMVGKYNGQYGCYKALPFAVYYDAATKGIYISRGDQGQTDMLIVADLDNPDHVGKGYEWEGFSTGEAYIDVRFVGNVLSRANLTVLGIVGQSMSGEFVTDTTTPYIVIPDLDESDVPLAKADSPYNVFGAFGADETEGALGDVAEVGVYRIDGESRVWLPVTDGAFTPDEEGTYYIEYFVRDAAGNIEIKTVRVDCKKNLPAIEVAFDSEIASAARTGDTITIPSVTSSGGAGRLSVRRYIRFENEEIAIPEDNDFTFEKAGTYTLVAEAVDHLGQMQKCEKTISVTNPDGVTVKEKPMPKAILAGKRYVFPEFTAIKYTSVGKEVRPVTITVNDTVLGADRAYTPTAGQKGQLTVIYSVDDYSKQFTVSVKVPSPFATDNEHYLSAYFVTDDGVSIEASGTDFRFVTEQQAERKKMSFINPLPVSQADFSLSVDKVANNFDKFNVYFTDSEDDAVKVKFTFKKGAEDESTSLFWLNDNQSAAQTMVGTFFGSVKPLAITLDGANLHDYDGNMLGTITSLLSGKRYNGFPSGKVYIDFEFEDVTGKAAVKLNSIWNQTFGDAFGDFIPPMLRVGSFTGEYKRGSTITIGGIEAFDVLGVGDDVTIKVTVNSSAGVVTDAAGEKLGDKTIADGDDVSFVLENYGRYEITITASDAAGNRFRYTKNFFVPCDTPPILRVSGSVVRSVALGGTITAPAATATDYKGDALRVFVYAVDSSSRYHDISNNGYVTTERGEITIVYYCVDEFGNYARETYTVKVE